MDLFWKFYGHVLWTCFGSCMDKLLDLFWKFYGQVLWTCFWAFVILSHTGNNTFSDNLRTTCLTYYCIIIIIIIIIISSSSSGNIINAHLFWKLYGDLLRIQVLWKFYENCAPPSSINLFYGI